MGHHIQVIIGAPASAQFIARSWPELPRLDIGGGYVVFPVDAELIDEKVAPERTRNDPADEFMLLTASFQCLLNELSAQGPLAYIETDYFGGAGGQGAAVYSHGDELLPPTWRRIGAIDAALELLGVERGTSRDRFESIGLDRVRSNDDLLDLILESDA